MFCVLGLYGRFQRQGNLEYELRVFLKARRPPRPPLQTHPHTHTMREKRRYNGALRILAVFQGCPSQPPNQGGGGVPKPPSKPAAARRTFNGARWLYMIAEETFPTFIIGIKVHDPTPMVGQYNAFFCLIGGPGAMSFIVT